MIFVFLALWAVVPTQALSNVHGPIVYLMDWKYEDIAKECQYLQGQGFGAVMVSPPAEHVVNKPKRPWHERYEVVSYDIKSRSGDIFDFSKMVAACYRKNIRVFVDVVINNMASTEWGEIEGSGGSKANPSNYEYPDFKNAENHFNKPCKITSYKDANMIRECQVAQLADLNAKHPYVREKQVDFLNYLLIWGISGFFVDKTKFMWPWELAVRQMRLKDLPSHLRGRPIMLYNVEDRGLGEAVKYSEYTDLGLVTDYRFGEEMTTLFKSKKNFIEVIERIKEGGSLVPNWIPSENALVFINIVYTYASDLKNVLRYNEDPANFKFATALMLALDYGHPLILSTYKMSKPVDEAGPPADDKDELRSPGVDCKFGWNCEHRLPEVSGMALFHLDCKGQKIAETFPGPKQGQFAFTRGNRGFVAFNLEDDTWLQDFQTQLPEGEYCEVVTGGMERFGRSCAKDALKLKVDHDGILRFAIPAKSVRAIHLWRKVGYEITQDDEPRIPYVKVKGVYKSFKLWVTSMFSKTAKPTAAPP